MGLVSPSRQTRRSPARIEPACRGRPPRTARFARAAKLGVFIVPRRPIPSHERTDYGPQILYRSYIALLVEKAPLFDGRRHRVSRAQRRTTGGPAASGHAYASRFAHLAAGRLPTVLGSRGTRCGGRGDQPRTGAAATPRSRPAIHN